MKLNVRFSNPDLLSQLGKSYKAPDFSDASPIVSHFLGL